MNSGIRKIGPHVPMIAVDVDGLQIQNIANSGADGFFVWKNVKNIDVGTPVGWKKKVVELLGEKEAETK